MMEFLTTAALCAVASIVIYIFYTINKYKNVPPGPWGIPILGYLPFINPEKPQITLTNLAKTYGPIYSLSMGSVFTVVLSDQKLIREAFSKDVFTTRAPLFLTHGIMNGKGIICAEDALWKDQRKLISAWLRDFGMTKRSANRHILEHRIINGVDELIKELEAKTEKPAFVLHVLAHTLGNIINNLAFGYTFNREDTTWVWLRYIQEASVEKMGIAGIVNFLPFLRFFSKSIRHIIKTVNLSQAQSHKIYASQINYTRKAMGIEKVIDDFKVDCISYNYDHKEPEKFEFHPRTLNKHEGDCILNRYITEQKRREVENEEDLKFVTDEQLKFFLSDIFGAGLDTTAVTLSWFFLLVAVHPDVQNKIRKEILSVCGSRAPDLNDWDLLKFTQASISEVQRIRSVVPIGIPHGCKETTTLAGYTIPAGTMLVALQWAVHMDSNTWNEPDKFKPSRFIDEEGNLIKPPEFIPFQTGKRMCPGDELARLILFLHVSRVLWRHRVRLPDEELAEDIEGRVGLTLTPPPIPLIFETVNE